MSDMRPAPLTPADCDLNGLEFMPLEVNRVMQSTLFGLSTGDEFKAAFALWCAAWYECPAASLPNDERMLEYLSRSKQWKRVRSVAMRGWVLCSDGRLYHETIAKVALSAWDRRVVHREENDSKAERQRRWRERCKHLAQLLRDNGITPPKGASLETLERLIVDAGVDAGVDGGTSTVDRGEIAKTGEGRTGEDRGGEDSSSTTFRGSSPPPIGDEPPPLLDHPAPGAGIPACDHQAVLALWRQHMPANPQPVKWTDTRRKHLQARWRELFAEGKATTRDDALAWFAKFFRYLAKSAFLTGRVTPREPGRPPFVLELHRLIEPEFWVQCIEGKYHQEA